MNDDCKRKISENKQFLITVNGVLLISPLTLLPLADSPGSSLSPESIDNIDLAHSMYGPCMEEASAEGQGKAKQGRAVSSQGYRSKLAMTTGN